MNNLERTKVAHMTRRARIRHFLVETLKNATRSMTAPEICDAVIFAALPPKAPHKDRARAILFVELERLTREQVIEIVDPCEDKSYLHYQMAPLQRLAQL